MFYNTRTYGVVQQLDIKSTESITEYNLNFNEKYVFKKYKSGLLVTK